MSPEEIMQKKREKLMVKQRFGYLFWCAWRSICEERGYKRDAFLGTSSHGTIALTGYLRAKGL